jgi:hypothetical protein
MALHGIACRVHSHSLLLKEQPDRKRTNKQVRKDGRAKTKECAICVMRRAGILITAPLEKLSNIE